MNADKRPCIARVFLHGTAFQIQLSRLFVFHRSKPILKGIQPYILFFNNFVLMFNGGGVCVEHCAVGCQIAFEGQTSGEGFNVGLQCVCKRCLRANNSRRFGEKVLRASGGKCGWVGCYIRRSGRHSVVGVIRWWLFSNAGAGSVAGNFRPGAGIFTVNGRFTFNEIFQLNPFT